MYPYPHVTIPVYSMWYFANFCIDLSATAMQAALHNCILSPVHIPVPEIRILKPFLCATKDKLKYLYHDTFFCAQLKPN
jgi:hypothetical protein